MEVESFMAEQKKKRFKFKYGTPRFLVQLVSLLLLNGLLLAELYPNLNLQRYPVTLPILLSINAPTNLAYGSLDVIQVALASPVVPWVALAFVFVIGAVLGRAFCGWVCPMGFIQDMVTIVRGPFGQVDVRMHESGKRFKYFVLGVALLVSVSLAISLSMGIGADYKNSLGIFANGLLIPLAPEGTLFSMIPRAIMYLRLEVAPTFLDKISANQLVTWIRSVPLMIYAGLILLFVFFYGAYKVPRFWCRYSMSSRSQDGSVPEVQLLRHEERSREMQQMSTLRGSLPNADPNPIAALGEVQRSGMHPMRGMRRRMRQQLVELQIPLSARVGKTSGSVTDWSLNS